MRTLRIGRAPPLHDLSYACRRLGFTPRRLRERVYKEGTGSEFRALIYNQESGLGGFTIPGRRRQVYGEMQCMRE